jgi:hypothetical protein
VVSQSKRSIRITVDLIVSVQSTQNDKRYRPLSYQYFTDLKDSELRIYMNKYYVLIISDHSTSFSKYVWNEVGTLCTAVTPLCIVSVYSVLLRFSHMAVIIALFVENSNLMFGL